MHNLPASHAHTPAPIRLHLHQGSGATVGQRLIEDKVSRVEWSGSAVTQQGGAEQSIAVWQSIAAL